MSNQLDELLATIVKFNGTNFHERNLSLRRLFRSKMVAIYPKQRGLLRLFISLQEFLSNQTWRDELTENGIVADPPNPEHPGNPAGNANPAAVAINNRELTIYNEFHATMAQLHQALLISIGL